MIEELIPVIGLEQALLIYGYSFEQVKDFLKTVA